MAAKPRYFLVTLFAVVGLIWYGVHAIEYVVARYAPLSAIVPLPAPLGLGGFLGELPLWASSAVTATIWLGLLGTFLLVLRDRASVLILSFALIAAVVALVFGAMAFWDGAMVLGGISPILFTGAFFVMTFGLWLYARTAKRSGTL